MKRVSWSVLRTTHHETRFTPLQKIGKKQRDLFTRRIVLVSIRFGGFDTLRYSTQASTQVAGGDNLQSSFFNLQSTHLLPLVLQLIQAVINTSLLQQFPMVAYFANFAFVHDDDFISVLDGR